MRKKVMGKIEKIYYDYSNALEENSVDTPEVITTSEALSCYLESKGIDLVRFDDYLGPYTLAMEKQGFINGFKYARDLLLSGN